MVSSNWSSVNIASVNTQSFPHSVIFAPYSNAPEVYAEYTLARSWTALEGTVGITDDSPTAAKMRFEAFGDGRLLYQHDFGVGQSQKARIEVSSVYRLKLVVTLLNPDSGSATGAWGDARLTS
jgi:hypothetical protein